MAHLRNLCGLLTATLPIFAIVNSAALADSDRGGADAKDRIAECQRRLAALFPDMEVDCRKKIKIEKYNLSQPGKNTMSPALRPDVSKPFLFLRQDQYDQITFSAPLTPLTTIQGASVSYTRDEKAHTQTATVQSYLGASIYQSEKYSFGAFAYADGTFNQPT